MTGYECEYCGKEFTRKDNLARHHQNTKCRTKFNDFQFTCEYCGKKLSNNYKLSSHYSGCLEYWLAEKDRIIAKKNRIIAKKNRIIAEKEQQLERLAMRAIDRPTVTTTTTHNNNSKNLTVQNFQPITSQFLSDQAQYLSPEHIKAGASGYAKYTVQHPCKERVLVSDPSRKRIRYKGENGEIVDDLGCTSLTQKLFAAFDERNQTLLSQAYDEHADKVKELMADENNRDMDRITAAMKAASKLADIQKYCKEIIDGKENKLQDKFVNSLVKLLGKE